MTRHSYARWLRGILRQVDAEPLLLSLTASGTPEPTELLEQLLAQSLKGVAPAYLPVIGGGNARVIAALARRYGVSNDAVLCTTGVSHAIALICRALLHPGDRVLVERPGFDLFAECAEQAGGLVHTVDRQGLDYRLDISALERAIRPDTRLIILANLNNPTGALIEVETLRALAVLAEARGIPVIFDEVYGGFAGIGIDKTAACQVSDMFLSVSSLTKVEGLSTLRCGWIVGASRWLKPVRALADGTDFGISKLAHAFAALVLESPKPFTERWRATLDAGRETVAARFREWGNQGLVQVNLPEFGGIALARLPSIPDTLSFSHWLVKEHRVVVPPGEFFGAPGHVRLGFCAAGAELEEALDRFEVGVAAYRAPGRSLRCE